MTIGAIITGDIVDSTKMDGKERDSMLKAIQSLPELLRPVTEISLEIFRGDSFQIGVPEPQESLRIATAIRACLRSNNFHGSSRQWDARMAIGIGTLDYEAPNLATSDGEAYRLSGSALDCIGKSRLKIATGWPDVNDELEVATTFADDIISSWTTAQSRIMFQSLVYRKTHQEIGNDLEISRQAVDKALKAAKETLIENYIKRFEQLITEHIA